MKRASSSVVAVFRIFAALLAALLSLPLAAGCSGAPEDTPPEETAQARQALAGPSITSFMPSRGPRGTLVTLTGTNLGGATSVKFGGVPASFTVVSATQVTATVPP